jgi:hypothetical protein
MIRINGYSVFELALALRPIIDGLGPGRPATDMEQRLGTAKAAIEDFLKLPYVPVDSRNALILVLASIKAVVREPSNVERGALIYSILQFQTMFARDLSWFDLYWIQPKLGYSTPGLLTDASVIFPETIRAAIPEKIKFEVQQAANCLLYEAPSAVGFHVLRAIEVVILDYFTIPTFVRGDANNWAAYTKVLRHHGVHRKIVAMVDRLGHSIVTNSCTPKPCSRMKRPRCYSR